MNYQAFTNDSLTMMYHGVRGALAVDDALCELGNRICRDAPVSFDPNQEPAALLSISLVRPP